MIEQELANDQELKGILGCVEPEKQDLPVIGQEIISENFPCSVGEGQNFLVNKLQPYLFNLKVLKDLLSIVSQIQL